MVRLSGLKARPALNGCIGTVTGELRADTGRLPLRVGEEADHAAEYLLLKLQNLTLVCSVPSKAPATPPPPPPPAHVPSTGTLPDSPMWKPPSILTGAGEEAYDALLLESACQRAGGTFGPMAPSSWMDAGATEGTIEPPSCDRSLVGGSIRASDMRTPRGREAAISAMVARRPIVMRGCVDSVAPALREEMGSLGQLELHLEGESVTVWRSPTAKFGRYADEKAPNYAHLPTPPRPLNERTHAKWEAFVSRLVMPSGGGGSGGGSGGGGGGDGAGGGGDSSSTEVMQLELCARGPTVHGGVSQMMARSESTEELLYHLHDTLEGPMAPLGRSLGPWQSARLVVSGGGVLSPCGHDDFDCIRMQLAASQRILVLPPDTPGLCAFPADHPSSSRAQTDLLAPPLETTAGDDDEATGTQLRRGSAAVIEVREGDAIYVPARWWVHAVDDAPQKRQAASRLSTAGALANIAVVLAFQNNDHHELTQLPPLPAALPAHVDAQIARAAEQLLRAAMPAGSASTRSLLTNALHLLETVAMPPSSRPASSAPASPAPATSDDELCRQLGVDAASSAGHALLARRNYVLRAVQRAYGTLGGASFWRAFLHPSRWAALGDGWNGCNGRNGWTALGDSAPAGGVVVSAASVAPACGNGTTVPLGRVARDADGRVVYVNMSGAIPAVDDHDAPEDATDADALLSALLDALRPTAPTREGLNELEVEGRHQRVLYEICDGALCSSASTREDRLADGGSARVQSTHVVHAFTAWLRAVVTRDGAFAEMVRIVLSPP